MLTVLGFALTGCRLGNGSTGPSIRITRIPPSEENGADKLDVIEGQVTGGTAGQQIVLYAKNGSWWIQPLVGQPITKPRANFSWINNIHLGTEYAALLVEPGYRPAANVNQLPPVGKGVAAVVTTKGSAPGAVSKMISFAGYDWRLRTAPSDRGGRSQYEPSNVMVDSAGAMHLHITRKDNDWTCAEATLSRSFGYGTYSIVVRDVSQLEPAAVLTAFTYDYAGGDQNNREMGIETSRWGDPTTLNGQYVLQPFYVPANATRFMAPAGPLTHTIHWEPGRATFRTVRGEHADSNAPAVGEHTFTSGVPSPGTETIRLNLYVFRNSTQPLQHDNEVVIEKFEYLP
jgi:hypothetical protein